jgi:hypothetical protein
MPLSRPQYVPVPEAFISEMAWKILSVELIDNPNGESSDTPMVKDPDGKPIGLLFRTDGGTSRIIKMKATFPSGTRMDAFVAELNKAGLQTLGPTQGLADAVLNSLDGLRVEKSGNQPASPLTPSIALLQNMRGVLGVKGPPDVAAIIESLFSLGADTAPSSLTACRLWLRAATHRMEIDPLLKALDSAVDNSLLGSRRRNPDPPAEGLPEPKDVSSVDYAGTPFEWFAKAWVRLTSDEWVEALPARVWVDWATTVLRLATGLGFLWECSWNEALARRVLQDGEASWEDVRSDVRSVLPWRSSRSGKVALDVAPELRSRVHRSERLRVLIGDWVRKHAGPEESFETVFADMRRDVVLRRDITEELGSSRDTNSGTNLWEAIKYALKTRETNDAHADYYGLLQSTGRYLSVKPGTEWIAVVASLSCEHPGTSTDVGRVLFDLEKMGMQPELADLISLLERAGMARGSADADQGVQVESAF